MPGWYEWDGNDLIVRVLVQPRSRTDTVVGVHGDSLKIKITAAPVDGKANQHLCDFLARLCDTSKSSVKVESGDTARNKRIRIKLPAQVLPKNLAVF